MARHLSLTPDLVARVTRPVPDSGPPPGLEMMQDADYDDWVGRMLASHPAPDRPTRLFAYGSLIWKPEIPHTAETGGTARGWHRSFCFRMPRYRGTPERPGLMMALDRGGTCRGVLLTLPGADLEGQFHRLFRREFTVKPINSAPRWITVVTGDGPVMALAFVMNRASPLYVGRLPEAEAAAVLASACGPVGSAAEYLMNTVSHLEARGIRDRRLWRLQKLVAEAIEAGPG